jgi:membrane fusion protein (multidrug efflux system)
MKMRKPYYTLSCIFLLFLVIFLFARCESKSKAAGNAPRQNGPVVVDVIIAEKQPVTDVIEANGTVIANEYVELRPEVSGRLTYLNLAEGRLITKGTVMARVNDAELRAQIAKSSVQLELAERTVERLKQLLDVNGVNQADYDVAVNQANSLKADIVYTQALVDKTVITAPFTGVVGLRQVSPGAYVTPATVIATLQQTNDMKIDFTLPEVYGNVIKTGSLVDVELDAGSRQRSHARIIAMEPGANTATRNLKVRALLSGSSVNPGAFVKVYINAGKGRSSIKIPANCIIPDDQNNQVVLVRNGKAEFVDIQTGIRESNNVEVTKGINVGDSVVITGVLFARPKAPLRVRQVKKPGNLADSTNAL